MTSASNLVTDFVGVAGSNVIHDQPDSGSGYSKRDDQLNDSKKIIALLEVIAENTTKSVPLLEKLMSGQISEQEPTVIAIKNEIVILNENSEISETNGHMTEPEINRPMDSLSRSNRTMVNDIFLEKVKAIPTELYMNSSIVDALQQVARSRSNFAQIVLKELFTNEERHRVTISGANDFRKLDPKKID
uniref:Uncharacterized protein n=1 Tax=Romanomermis culicivorax TaxID=13658 RepID=A0A915HRV8_ROMCU